MRAAAGICIGALAVCACSPQATPEYPGDPLVTLHGTVQNASPYPLPDVVAALLWQRGPPPTTGDEELATRARVEGRFPAEFVLRLYLPPPDAARHALLPGEVRYARANAAIVPPSVAPGAAQVPSSSSALALDVTRWFVFLEAAPAAESLTAWWPGGTPAAGYQLVAVDATDPACLTPAEIEACVGRLGARGVAPADAAGFCQASYRLRPVPFSEGITLTVGASSTPELAAGCR